ncbi:hypothetical protein Avbf_02843 [Armadillidium vulgare]|nr:hypothetical protein Avbf_02843 [Armadillidium vulgare]
MTSSCSIDSKPPVCEGCDNTVTKFTLLSESDENLLQFLYNHRVLPKKKICRECENEMWLDENNFLFVCRNKCNSSVSQLKGTIFENSDLSLKIISRFVMLWSQIHPPCPVLLQHELGMSAATSFGDIEKKAVEKKRHRSGKHKKGRKRLRPIDNDQN